MTRKNILETGPDVVSEDGFRGLLKEGYLAEVVCRESATKSHNTFTGIWIIQAVSPDGEIQKTLVTSRNNFKVREFKTISGLVGFFDQFNVPVQKIPWYEGGSVRISIPPQ